MLAGAFVFRQFAQGLFDGLHAPLGKTIGLGVVWRGQTMIDEAGGQESMEGSLKLGALIGEHLCTRPEPANDMGEKRCSSGASFLVDQGNALDVLGQRLNADHGIAMP